MIYERSASTAKHVSNSRATTVIACILTAVTLIVGTVMLLASNFAKAADSDLTSVVSDPTTRLTFSLNTPEGGGSSTFPGYDATRQSIDVDITYSPFSFQWESTGDESVKHYIFPLRGTVDGGNTRIYYPTFQSTMQKATATSSIGGFVYHDTEKNPGAASSFTGVSNQFVGNDGTSFSAMTKWTNEDWYNFAGDGGSGTRDFYYGIWCPLSPGDNISVSAVGWVDPVPSVSVPVPTRAEENGTQYRFLGWSTTPDGTPMSFEDIVEQPRLAIGGVTPPTERVTLYARWAPVHMRYAAIYGGDTFVFGQAESATDIPAAYEGKALTESWFDPVLGFYNSTTGITTYPVWYNSAYRTKITTAHIIDKVEIGSARYFFSLMSSLKEVTGLENMLGVTDAYCMFRKTNLSNIDLTKVDFSACANFDEMFYECASLQSVRFSSTVAFGADFLRTFYSCEQLTDVNFQVTLTGAAKTDSTPSYNPSYFDAMLSGDKNLKNVSIHIGYDKNTNPPVTDLSTLLRESVIENLMFNVDKELKCYAGSTWLSSPDATVANLTVISSPGWALSSNATYSTFHSKRTLVTDSLTLYPGLGLASSTTIGYPSNDDTLIWSINGVAYSSADIVTATNDSNAPVVTYTPMESPPMLYAAVYGEDTLVVGNSRGSSNIPTTYGEKTLKKSYYNPTLGYTFEQNGKPYYNAPQWCYDYKTKITTAHVIDNVSISTLLGFFSGLPNLISVDGLEKISDVTNMENMFDDDSSLVSISGLSRMDVSRVLDASQLFQDCAALKSVELPDFTQCNDVRWMFQNCIALKNVDISLHSAGTMNCGLMLASCDSLDTATVRIDGTYNSTISLYNAFSSSTIGTLNISISGDVAPGTKISLQGAFSDATIGTVSMDIPQSLQLAAYGETPAFSGAAVNNLVLKSIPSMDSGMTLFSPETRLTKSLMLYANLGMPSGMFIPDPVGDDTWWVANEKPYLANEIVKYNSVDTAEWTTWVAKTLKSLTYAAVYDRGGVYDLVFASTPYDKPPTTFGEGTLTRYWNLKDYDAQTPADVPWANGTNYLKDVTDVYFQSKITMSNANYLLYQGGSIQRIHNPTNLAFGFGASAKYMYGNCTQLTTTSLPSVIARLKNAEGMFSGCTALTSLATQNPTFDSLENAERMFAGCENLASSEWTKSMTMPSLTTAEGMFNGCKSLTSVSMNIGSMDEGTAGTFCNANNMFDGCSGLTALNLTKCNMSTLETSSFMFRGCSGLKSQIGISNWDMSKNTDMSGMFEGCENILVLDVGTWNTSSCTNMSRMFRGCKSLQRLNLLSFDVSKVVDMQYMFENCGEIKRLDLSTWHPAVNENTEGMFNGVSKLYTIVLTADWEFHNGDNTPLPNYYDLFHNGNDFEKVRTADGEAMQKYTPQELPKQWTTLTAEQRAGTWERTEELLDDPDSGTVPEMVKNETGEPVLQYYAYFRQICTHGKDAAGNTVPSIKLINGSGGLPKNEYMWRGYYDEANSPNAAELIPMYLESKPGNKYVVRTDLKLTKMYRDKEHSVSSSAVIPKMDEFAQDPTNAYTTTEIWRLKDDASMVSTRKQDFDIFPYSSATKFIHTDDIASENDNDKNNIFYTNDSVIRFVAYGNEKTSDFESEFRDYDITDGQYYLSNADAIAGTNGHSTETQQDTAMVYTNTDRKGINAVANYTEDATALTSFTFGNANAVIRRNEDGTLGTPSASVMTKTQTDAIARYVGESPNPIRKMKGDISRYNQANRIPKISDSEGLVFYADWNAKKGLQSYRNCAFGMTTGLGEDGYPQFRSEIHPPMNLFSTENGNGVTYYDNTYPLRFKQYGNVYSLDAVAGTRVNTLNEFEHPGSNSTIWTNNFWPMDDASSYGTAGHDIRFGNATNRIKRLFVDYYTYSSKTSPLPVSDDELDHNAYFGMNFSVKFNLNSNYCGPLNYSFYGDDDMWVYLDGKLVADLGGVHATAGYFLNLWDYLPKDSSEFKGPHELSVFYFERGASGSSCWMQLALPNTQESAADVTFTKVDSEDHNALLPNAQFNLYTDQSCTEDTFVRSATSDENGVVTMNEVFAGTYYMKEVQSPSGYSVPNILYKVDVLSKTDIKVSIAAVDEKDTDTVLSATDESGNTSYKITNKKIVPVLLPNTGGGASLVVLSCAGLMLVLWGLFHPSGNRRRRRNRTLHHTRSALRHDQRE